MTALLVALAVVCGGDSLKTEVMFLDGMPAERAISLWERVIGPQAGATIIQGRAANVVVVKDTPARIARFRTLMKALASTGADAHIYLRPVLYMEASELAAVVSNVAGQSDAMKDVALVPDDRSGQLVVSATPARYRALDALMRRLDVPATTPRRVIGVEPEPDGGLPR